MLLKSTIRLVVEAQKESITKLQTSLPREAFELLPELAAHVLIVSGIRRCGKSTLLFQLLRDKYKDALYLNFEDPRLYEFNKKDFTQLDELIREGNYKVLLFDELQVIPEWEKYVRQKLDEQYKVVVTGSNASLLSRELGTKLTGRHITKELFPFSYTEYCSFIKEIPNYINLENYLQSGGFPEFLKNKSEEILQTLFDDILVRDIAVRYHIRDLKSLQRLALYLVSNTGKLLTANRIKSLFEIASTSTMMEYLSHLEFAYLFSFVPKFSFSIRKQMINPRKVYAIDTGFINANSSSFTEDKGRKFENLIFLHLRRQEKEIYYFEEKGECDFVVFRKGSIFKVIQVCYDLSQSNLKRELDGLMAAIKFFQLKEGFIITPNQKELMMIDNCTIHILPAHEWMANATNLFPVKS